MQSAASYVRRASAWNMVSAERGPSTACPSRRSVSMTGARISISSRPMVPSSPAWGFNPAIASRGLAIPKSLRSDCKMTRAVPAIAGGSSRRKTSDRAMWIVYGTTRSGGSISDEASIITACFAPVKAARNSVCPGNPNPASVRTDFWIGPVTRPAASPPTQRATQYSIAAVTAPAWRADGRPGSAFTGRPVSMMAARSETPSRLSRAAVSRKSAGVPAIRNGRPAMLPRNRAKALMAISGPMPDGSPWLIRIGRRACPSPVFDNGVAPEIAKIALAEDRHFLNEQLLLQFVPGRELHRDDFLRRRIASHEDFQPYGIEERLDHVAGMGFLQRFCQIRHQIFRLGRAEFLELRSLDLLGNIGQILARLDLGLDVCRKLHGAIFGRLIGRRWHWNQQPREGHG